MAKFRFQLIAFLGEPASDVFVEHTGDQGLIWHAFLHCFYLNVPKIASRQPDVDSLVLGRRCASRLTNLVQLFFCDNKKKRA